MIEDEDIVSEVVAAFDAYKASRVFDVPERTPLAWGNRTARTTLAAFIDAADKVLLIQHTKPAMRRFWNGF